MTNKRKFGVFLRALGLPVVLLFTGFGGYCLFVFWEQEVVAKELYSWEPVTTTDYEIKKIEEPVWPSARALPQSEDYEEEEKEFRTRQRGAPTLNINEYTIGISYRYKYHGYAGDGNMLSPFYELNTQALRDPQLHRYLLREDHPPLTVYVNPDQPARSALVRGWAQDDRWGALLIGGVLLPLSLAMFYFLVRPADRVEELFKT